jgi:hypothetical protein
MVFSTGAKISVIHPCKYLKPYTQKIVKNLGSLSIQCHRLSVEGCMDLVSLLFTHVLIIHSLTSCYVYCFLEPGSGERGRERERERERHPKVKMGILEF